jgi:hypothetical protein
VLAVDRGADDPRLPYGLATPEELDATVAATDEAMGEERARAAIPDATDATARPGSSRERRRTP